jgi:serpin B
MTSSMKKTTGICIVVLIAFSVIMFVYVSNGQHNVGDFLPSVKTAPIATNPTSIVKTDAVAPSEITSLVGANNQFAFDLYSYLAATKSDNIFFSPYSLNAALTMATEGARGQTASEMQKVLHISQNDDARRAAAASIYSGFDAPDRGNTIKAANSLWVEKNYPVLTEYFSLIAKYYGGQVTNLDFVQNPEGSRESINAWVENQTNHKIQELMSRGTITDLTRLVLASAIYFKDKWLIPFDKSQTASEDFRVSPTKTVKVNMMSLTGDKANFKYSETPTLQILELPYSNPHLAMLIFLPKGTDLSAIDGALSSTTFATIQRSLVSRRVEVYIPRFTFSSTYSLADDLRHLGMVAAFSDTADFSGMIDNRQLSISDVIHKAFIDVNEEGTEASAAGGVLMQTLDDEMQTPQRIPIFKANHPFVFMIEDDATSEILFIGRVDDPTLGI